MAIIDTLEDTGLQKSNSTKQIKFGITDARFVQKILRSDVYSNKPRIIVQEYLSNARDAHREAGNVLTPIDVTLPTFINNKIFEIRDYGIGVDPERFEKVFVQYGSSTKRGSNKEVGGFGIGAKSAWAYTNEFFVTTWTEENSSMIERRYRCYVSDDGWSYGELLYEKTNNDEKRGTKVSIQLLHDDDIESFVKNFHNVTYFWGIKPKVINSNYQYQEWKTITANDNWILYDSYNGIRNGPVAILDGIPYAVLPEELSIDDERVMRLINHGIHFHVDTGEVSVALNRESLNYDANTINYLKKTLTSIVDDMFYSLKSQLSHKKNLWEAEIEWEEKYKETVVGRIIKTCEWNDIEIGSNQYKIPYETKRVSVIRRVEKDMKHHFTIRKCSKIKFESGYIFIVNDSSKAPSPNVLMTIFNLPENLDKNKAYIVNAGEVKAFCGGGGNIYEDWCKSFNIEHFGAFFTSQYPKWKGKVPFKPRTKLSLKQAIVVNNHHQQPVLRQQDVEIDDSVSGWYLKTERGLINLQCNDGSRLHLPFNNLAFLINDLFNKEDVYIVPKPLWKKISKIKKLNLIDDELIKRCRDKTKTFDVDDYKKQISFKKYKNLNGYNMGLGLRKFLSFENSRDIDPLFSEILTLTRSEDEYYNNCLRDFENHKKYDIEKTLQLETTSIEAEKPEHRTSIDVLMEINEKYPMFELLNTVPEYSLKDNFQSIMNKLINRLKK